MSTNGLALEIQPFIANKIANIANKKIRKLAEISTENESIAC